VNNAKGGGVWDDLCSSIVPEWIDAGIGMEFTTFTRPGCPGPKSDVQTKNSYFKVRNMYGKESECRLFSLNIEKDAESILKALRFSMIYFPELTNFKSKTVFTASVPQLRMMNLPASKHQWISDTNPSDDGEESWIYKLFWDERTDPKHPEPVFQKGLNVIHVNWDDNPYLTEEDKAEIRGICGNDDDLYDRYVRGQWKSGGLRERHFKNYFSRDKHVIGCADSQDEEKWEVITPTKMCHELCTGWDLGDTNLAACIFEKVNPGSENYYYAVLDELVRVKSTSSLEDFVLEFMRKMEVLESQLDHKVMWSNWSDSQATDQYKANINGMDAMVVRAVSEGKIDLIGVPKGAGSVGKRISMAKRLFMKDKIFISANCKYIIEMLSELRKGSKPGEEVGRSDKFKHAFDALTYGLQMEEMYELQSNTLTNNMPRSQVIV
jgi:hypothetical protein